MPETTKSRLGKYELLELIGDGAEGRIFKARCIEDGVPGVAVGEIVALKRLRQTGNETQSDIFQRTARILRALDHPNIIRYKDSFVSTDDALGEEVYCLVTELLEGETLKELMDRNKTGLPWDRARGIILAALDALDYAGRNAVVHRDLKPSNIYLTKGDQVKLIDFGIARDEDGGSTATSAGSLLGSFDFMAPDFVLMTEGNFRGDQQSDIFSFGVCVYQVLTGALPFPPLGGNAQIAYFQRYVSPEKIPAVKYNHSVFGILRGARACLEKCLACKREERFKTFAEARAAIEAVRPRLLEHTGGDTYEYVEYIGKGGFGKVYRGRRLRDDFAVAIKEVVAGADSTRFIREAKLLKAREHPHLVKYLDFLEMTDETLGEERRLFLVLEYLPGMPQFGLNHRIRMTRDGMEPLEVLEMFAAYLDCLEYLHQNAIIHRDIKPGNLYAPPKAPQSAKIFDLGIAHDTEGTKTHGQVPGTLDYMPAEFAVEGSDRGSAQSDIYSLGVTLFQALTGKLPLERLPDDEKTAWTAWYLRCENPPEIFYTHPVFLHHPGLEKLLRRALARRPPDRFASAGAMRDELRAILARWNPSAGPQLSQQQIQCDAALAQAREHWNKGDLDAAAAQAQKAVALAPSNGEARQLLEKIGTQRALRLHGDTASTDTSEPPSVAIKTPPPDTAVLDGGAVLKRLRRERFNPAFLAALVAELLALAAILFWIIHGFHFGPPALVIYSDGVVTRNLGDQSGLLIPCLARNPKALHFSSSRPAMAPGAYFTQLEMPNEATNGGIYIRLTPGFTGDAVITIKASGHGLASVTKTVRVRVTGQPAPPRIESGMEEYYLDPGADGEVLVTPADRYGYRPAEFDLTVDSVRPAGLLNVSAVERTPSGFSIPVHALHLGSASMKLALTAPNGTSAHKTISIIVQSKPKSAAASALPAVSR